MSEYRRMMTPTQSIQKFYEHFVRGEFDAAFSYCDPKATFEIKGKSKLAGKFDRQTIANTYSMRLKELSGGTFSLETHDILGSDRHVIMLGTAKLVREGKPLEYRTVHVWRFENGKPIAGYEYLRDQYQFDQIWS